jgi:hypothetical protein
MKNTRGLDISQLQQLNDAFAEKERVWASELTQLRTDKAELQQLNNAFAEKEHVWASELAQLGSSIAELKRLNDAFAEKERVWAGELAQLRSAKEEEHAVAQSALIELGVLRGKISETNVHLQQLQSANAHSEFVIQEQGQRVVELEQTIAEAGAFSAAQGESLAQSQAALETERKLRQTVDAELRVRAEALEATNNELAQLELRHQQTLMEAEQLRTKLSDAQSMYELTIAKIAEDSQNSLAKALAERDHFLERGNSLEISLQKHTQEMRMLEEKIEQLQKALQSSEQTFGAAQAAWEHERNGLHRDHRAAQTKAELLERGLSEQRDRLNERLKLYEAGAAQERRAFADQLAQKDCEIGASHETVARLELALNSSVQREQQLNEAIVRVQNEIRATSFLADQKLDSLSVKFGLVQQDLQSKLQQASLDLAARNAELVSCLESNSTLSSDLKTTKKQLALQAEQLVRLAQLFDGTLVSLASMPTHLPSEKLNEAIDSQILLINPLLAKDGVSFVTGAYSAFLSRVPDPAGASFYLESLNKGTHKFEILQAIAFSEEAAGARHSPPNSPQAVIQRDWAALMKLEARRFVCGLYQSVLGRDPDPEGLASHLSRLQEGESKAQLVMSIAASDEAKQFREEVRHSPHLIPLSSSLDEMMKYQGTTYIRAAYIGLLGREPDKVGLACYMPILERRHGKQKIAIALADSVEGKSYLIGRITYGPQIKAVARSSLRARLSRVLGTSYTDDANEVAVATLQARIDLLHHIHLTAVMQRDAKAQQTEVVLSSLKSVLNKAHSVVRTGIAARDQLQLRDGLEAATLIDAEFVSKREVAAEALTGAGAAHKYEWLQGPVETKGRKTALETFAARLKVLE